MQAQPVIAPRRGRPKKDPTAPDTPAKRVNRERVARFNATKQRLQTKYRVSLKILLTAMMNAKF